MSLAQWDPKARDFLRKLPKDIAKRLFEKVDKDIRHNVKHYLESLVSMSIKKIRIGDYRLFVDFYEDKDLLVIRTIQHRKDAYK